jgi:hypothetical protein
MCRGWSDGLDRFANASEHSRDRLVEGSLQVTDAATAGDVRRWIADLADKSQVLGAADLRRLVTLKPKTPRLTPGSPTSEQIPKDAKRLLVTHFYDNVSARAHHLAERTQANTMAEIRRVGARVSALDWFEWWGEPALKVGDWVIDVSSGHRPGRPLLIHSIKVIGRGKCVAWCISSVGGHLPPRRELLETAIDARELEEDARVVRRNRVKNVLALYRQ